MWAVSSIRQSNWLLISRLKVRFLHGSSYKTMGYEIILVAHFLWVTYKLTIGLSFFLITSKSLPSLKPTLLWYSHSQLIEIFNKNKEKEGYLLFWVFFRTKVVWYRIGISSHTSAHIDKAPHCFWGWCLKVPLVGQLTYPPLTETSTPLVLVRVKWWTLLLYPDLISSNLPGFPSDALDWAIGSLSPERYLLASRLEPRISLSNFLRVALSDCV